MPRKSGAARWKAKRERARQSGNAKQATGATADHQDPPEAQDDDQGKRAQAAPDAPADAVAASGESTVESPGSGDPSVLARPVASPVASSFADQMVREMEPRPRGVEPLPPLKPVDFPDPPVEPPWDPNAEVRSAASKRGPSGLTFAEETRLHARAVRLGWIGAEFPIHKTAAELEATRVARGGHLTLAEELAVANALAAKTVPRLAPLAARAGATMVATNARLEAERARAVASEAAAEIMETGDMERAVDLAEAALFRLGYAGDRHALETFLRARGRGRGYVERREVVSANIDLMGDTAEDLLERLGFTPAAAGVPSIEARLSAGVPSVLDGGDPAEYRPARRARPEDGETADTEGDE